MSDKAVVGNAYRIYILTESNKKYLPLDGSSGRLASNLIFATIYEVNTEEKAKLINSVVEDLNDFNTKAELRIVKDWSVNVE